MNGYTLRDNNSTAFIFASCLSVFVVVGEGGGGGGGGGLLLRDRICFL